jgi:hypothetical protein
MPPANEKHSAVLEKSSVLIVSTKALLNAFKSYFIHNRPSTGKSLSVHMEVNLW